MSAETHKNPDSLDYKNLVAGFATMGGPQGSKVEGKDRDPEGTRTCLRCMSSLGLAAS